MDSRIITFHVLSIPLYGFCTITLHVHCGNFSHLHCMDSIPLSPQLGAPCMRCGIWYLSFSLSSLIVFPCCGWEFPLYTVGRMFMGRVSEGNVYKLWFMCGFELPSVCLLFNSMGRLFVFTPRLYLVFCC